MCLMCIEVAQNRMKISEAKQALKELIMTAERPEDLAHYQELAKMSDEGLKKSAEKYSPKNIKKTNLS